MNREELKKFFDDNIKEVDAELAVYDYAMRETETELKQAVEGMYHNLNSLN